MNAEFCTSGTPGAAAELAALSAAAAGKPPPAGAEWLLVPRPAEQRLFEQDLALIADGTSLVRLVVGEVGSGKTCLLHSLGVTARAAGFATATASLSPDQLLHGRNGEAVSLLSDCLLSLRTLGSPGESAVEAVVARLADDCIEQAERIGRDLDELLAQRLAPLQRLQRGFDFAHIITHYALALIRGDPIMSGRAKRWLLAGYTSPAEARDDLGIGSIISDVDVWRMLKLWSAFLRICGRPGLIIVLDEVRLIADLHAPVLRQQNFEQLLFMFNELASGAVPGLSLVLAVTPGFLNTDRGLGKFEPLAGCLQATAGGAPADLLVPSSLIRLQALSDEQLLELLSKYSELIGRCRPDAKLLPSEGRRAFLETCRSEIGSPLKPLRTIIQEFIDVHNRLAASQSLQWQDLLTPVTNGSALEAVLLSRGGFAQRRM